MANSVFIVTQTDVFLPRGTKGLFYFLFLPPSYAGKKSGGLMGLSAYFHDYSKAHLTPFSNLKLSISHRNANECSYTFFWQLRMRTRQRENIYKDKINIWTLVSSLTMWLPVPQKSICEKI